MGFRNPYRIVLRPDSGSHYPDEGNPGDLYVGDVGNGRWEELDIVTRGGQNFGWPVFEGNERMYAFSLVDVPDNRMAPNPLYDNGTCDQAFFNFRDLIIRPKREEDPTFSNPCDPFQVIPPEAFPMVEELSAIVWNNSKWNPPLRTIIPGFDENGGVYSPQISDPESPVTGEDFEGFSSLAGVFYTGDAYPEAYRGIYFAVDFSGWIKTMQFDEENHLISVEPFHDDVFNIIHLAQNPHDGLLYYVNLDGAIRKISYGGNPPPVPIITTDQSYGPGPLTVQFDASDSYDSNLPIASYLWDFGDGTSSTDITPSKTFTASSTQPTSYSVRLTVTDLEGASATTTEIISINNTPPTVRISSFEDGDQYPMGETTLLILEADVRDAEHEGEDLTYAWRVFFHHNDHYHPEPIDRNEKTFTLISPLGCEEEIYWYRVELTVTDAAGLATTDSRSVYPYCGAEFVEFINLQGEAEDQFVQLDWQTDLEEDISSFELQRSSDFFDFETIATFGPNASKAYFYQDMNPLRGNNIYRIKAIQNSRAYDYSNFVTVNYPKLSPIRIYPNPAGSSFELEILETKAGLVTLELFSTAGIRLFSTQWQTDVGIPLVRQIISTQLNNGLYFYRIINGTEEQVGRLMIAK